MIEFVEEILNNLNFWSFIFIVMVFFVSFALSKINHIKRLMRNEDVEIETGDNFHIFDRIFFIIGIIVVIYLLVTLQVKNVIEFLQNYDITIISLLMIGTPLVLLLAFIQSVGKYFKKEDSVTYLGYNIFVEFCLYVFYASFLTIAIPLILYLIR